VTNPLPTVDLPLMILGKKRSAQMWPDMAVDASGRRCNHRRVHPAVIQPLTPEPDQTCGSAKHKVWNREKS